MALRLSNDYWVKLMFRLADKSQERERRQCYCTRRESPNAKVVCMQNRFAYAKQR